MNSDLKRQEKASLDAIDKYKENQVSGKSQGPTLVTDIDCFWEECEKIPGSNRRAF